jgi:hypothetical protein
MSCIINKARLNLGKRERQESTKKFVEFFSSLEGKVKGMNSLHF